MHVILQEAEQNRWRSPSPKVLGKYFFQRTDWCSTITAHGYYCASAPEEHMPLQKTCEVRNLCGQRCPVHQEEWLGASPHPLWVPHPLHHCIYSKFNTISVCICATRFITCLYIDGWWFMPLNKPFFCTHHTDITWQKSSANTCIFLRLSTATWTENNLPLFVRGACALGGCARVIGAHAHCRCTGYINELSGAFQYLPATSCAAVVERFFWNWGIDELSWGVEELGAAYNGWRGVYT